jgi:3-oxoacyl-[acyl-carrier protein] reductase
MDQHLKGKVAIVTGGASGIGRAAARALAEAGAAVVVADLNPGRAQEAAAAITDAGGRAAAVAVDVSRPADVQRMVATAVEQFGRLDILYNNAGISPDGTITETSEALWDTTVAIDLTAVFLGTKYAIPEMQKAGGGVILNTAGTLGIMPCQRKAAYAAAKAGVISLTRSTALDYSKDRIRCVAICPGLVVGTDLVQHTDQLAAARGVGGPATRDQGETDAEFTEYQLLPGQIEAEDIARLVVFLASDAARMITGQTYVLDGGQTAGLR